MNAGARFEVGDFVKISFPHTRLASQVGRILIVVDKWDHTLQGEKVKDTVMCRYRLECPFKIPIQLDTLYFDYELGLVDDLS